MVVIDVRRLEVLVAFARTGNVTAAADELNFTQPTVSHHLHRLEAETGAVLLRRVGRNLVLTADGRRLAERGEAVLALLAAAQSELDASTSLESGTVRLAIFPSGVATLGPRIMIEVRRRHPGLTVELTEAEPPLAEELLLANTVDLALSFAYPGQQANSVLTSESLGRDPLFLISPKGVDGPGGVGGALTVRDLGGFAADDWLAGCERCRGYLVSTCHSAGFYPRISFASDDYIAVQSLVAVGHGVSMLPQLALQAHTDPGVTATPIEGAGREITLLTLGRPPFPSAVEAVRGIVEGVLSHLRPPR